MKSLNNKKLEENKEEVKYIKDLFDFSDYPKEHFLYSDENKKVIGIPKDEYKGKVTKEATALKSKLYFLDILNGKIIKKVKGITKATIKHQINIDDAKDCLMNKKNKWHKNYCIRAQKFEVNTIEQNKISMSPFDNKRYLVNNIETIPYCSRETENNILKEKLKNVLDDVIDSI